MGGTSVSTNTLVTLLVVYSIFFIVGFVGNVATIVVIVKNEYAGINFIDTYHRSGLYARELPFVGGQEGGGDVRAQGMGAQEAEVRPRGPG